MREGLNLTNLGKAPSRDHHRQPLPSGHEGAHVDHVDTISKGDSGARQRRGGFTDRQAFSRQRRFVDAEALRLDEPAVGRDIAARLEDENVSRHHLCRR